MSTPAVGLSWRRFLDPSWWRCPSGPPRRHSHWQTTPCMDSELACTPNNYHWLLRRPSTSRLARCGSTAITCLTLPPGLAGSNSPDLEEMEVARDCLSM